MLIGKRGSIDEATTDAQAALAGADAVILAAPPCQICEHLAQIAPLLAPGTFVTDVGSVKEAIVRQAEAVLPASALFVGSHPMAGGEKPGAANGRADLYEGAACLLPPTARTRPDALELARRFWEALGSRVVVIDDPARHDCLLAGVSHLPHVVACALMQALARGDEGLKTVGAIAAGGLRDTTRIAASDPAMWRQIIAENAPSVLCRLDGLIAVLQEWRAALDRPAPDADAIERSLAEGQAARQGLDAPPET